MHFSWLMHLFIFVLLSRFSSGSDEIYSDDSEENELTTKSIIIQDRTEEIEDYDGKEETIETTTPMKKTPIHYGQFHKGARKYYGDYEDETEDEKISSTTLIATKLSSSSKISLTTHVITETTTSKNEVPVTHSTSSLSTILYDTYRYGLWTTTTMDPEKIAVFLARANRDRLFLKIFAITTVVGMSSLAVVLITIHLVQKTGRYHGYRTPAHTSSNEQSKHFNNIEV